MIFKNYMLIIKYNFMIINKKDRLKTMLKKLFTNKKFLIGLTVIVLGTAITLSGITGAWWHIIPTDELLPTVDFQMGELDVSVALIEGTEKDEIAVYEPGKFEWCGITIENNGNIDAFIKLEFGEGIVTDEFDVPDIEKSVEINFRFDYIKESDIIVDGIESYIFYKDEDKNIYLEIHGNGAITINDCIELQFIGDKMDNNSMNDIINIALNWEATQMNTGAIQAELNLDFSGLLPVNLDD